MDAAFRFLEVIYGPFGADDSVSASEVLAAEARLGVKLPAALVALYRRTGRATSLHESHNRLVTLEQVDFAGDHLVFYEENQDVVVWGIERSRLADDDPPVDQGQPTAAPNVGTFYPEFASVSEFARAQGAWQAVQGGLPYVGALTSPAMRARSSEAQALAANAAPARAFRDSLGEPALETAGMLAWLVDGGVFVDARGYLGLATREASQFEAACVGLGIEVEDWDYATLTDE